MTSTLRSVAIGRFWPYRTGAIHNVVYELRRILLLGTSVNKGRQEWNSLLWQKSVQHGAIVSLDRKVPSILALHLKSHLTQKPDF
jgi:hypothetical protein